ncbi:MAG: aryl-sulfate sulfotransferase [Gemmatimonadaceae bacterium]|nr:aryl-sulfate sulfotransferase [Gemmatimonadaceae bacterium]
MQSTPFYKLETDSGSITALGLTPDTRYQILLEVAGAGRDTTIAMEFRSGTLPPGISGLELRGTGAPTAGYTITDYTATDGAYIVVFDATGALAWYRKFAAEPGESALDAEQQSNGDFTLFVGASTGWQPTAGRFYQVTPGGKSVNTFAASGAYFTDPHELLVDFNAGKVSRTHLFGYDLRHVDLRALGGKEDQLVAGHVLLRQSAAGTVEFAWSAWDHFAVTDWLFVPRNVANLPNIDFDHPNAIDRDSRGNYLLSFAALGEITKIDANTGAIIWRFGGKHNQFEFVGDPFGGFGTQHDARFLPNGDILLMDNGQKHSPPESRAVEYRLNEATHTATMIWEFRQPAGFFSPFAGSVQRLSQGNTLLAFGAAAHLTEVGAGGSVLWEADLTNDGRRAPFLYRARRIASLYQASAP